MAYHTQFLPRKLLLFLKVATLPLLGLIIYALINLYQNNLAALTLGIDFPPIKPVTILSFIVVLIGFWAILLSHRTLIVICSIILIASAIPSIFDQYSHTGPHSHLYFSFLTHLEFTPSNYLTSLSFFFLALIMLILSNTKLRSFELVICALLTWFILSYAQLSSIVFIFYHPGITSAGYISTALLTTLGFLYIVGLYAVLILAHVYRLYPSTFSRWVLLSLIMIGVTGGYGTWRSAQSLQNAFYYYATEAIAQIAKNSFVKDVENKKSILENTKQFLANPTDENEKSWEKEASIFMKENPEVIVVAAYNPSKNIVWRLSTLESPGIKEALDRKLAENPNVNFIIDADSSFPALIISNRTGDLDQPFFAVLVDINSLFTKLSSSTIVNQFGISLLYEQKVLYSKYTNDQSLIDHYASETKVDLTIPPLIIKVWPTKALYSFLKTPLPKIIIIFNASALLLTLIILYYAELARIRGENYLKERIQKSFYFANISHEIRTQLQGILGTSSLLERTELTEKQIKMLQIIKSSSFLLERLLKDLLDVAKFDSGKMKLEYAPTAVKKSVENVVNSMKARARDKGIELNLKIQPNVPDHILMDRARFEQIISNLVTNAIKFTYEGSVVVKLSSELTDESDKVIINVSVSDTGIGIPEAFIGKIFDQFYQVKSVRNKAIEGTGLGLSISKTLTEYMGGTLTCSSEEDVGSIFTLRLPVTIIKEGENP